MAKVFGLKPEGAFKEKSLLFGDRAERIQVSTVTQDVILGVTVGYGKPEFEVILFLTARDGRLRRAFHFRSVSRELLELPISEVTEGFERERAFWLRWRGGTKFAQ